MTVVLGENDSLSGRGTGPPQDLVVRGGMSAAAEEVALATARRTAPRPVPMLRASRVRDRVD
ncbi:hypothetical protein BLA24_13215 [Streptomyces cinnamoneus]|uniref:Uncharacterized protein n=1 Tax=Streptomyces cinnamoneus TaxID=53446 RepID=A0A2G1XJT8_STRCJ|nr:hypothetical protein BLA24_13215 [Streptomyces cinnamoneus]PPT11652.1 hypothetical protein CYQ11_00935 [Streptomyces cinnamoneus]